jgi:hypothetical protein
MDAKEMERVWDDHNAAEFGIKDADTALKTMVENPYVHAVAAGPPVTGREQVRSFSPMCSFPDGPTTRRCR